MGRSDTGVTTGWTEGKPCEIAWGELHWEGTDGATIRWTERKPWEIDRVDGREAVGNSLGRAPVGWWEGAIRE